MDISPITESHIFNKILVKNFTDLQIIFGTLVMVLTPIWLFTKFVILKLYKSFLWKKPRLKVTNILFGVSSPNDFSSIQEVLVTNCSASKIEISKIEIIFLRKKEHFELELSIFCI